MKKHIALLLLCGASLSHAELQDLDNQALQMVEAQAGADLSLKLRLNHVDRKWDGSAWVAAPNSFDDGPGGVCDKTAKSGTGLGYCHLGISVNKRFVKSTTNTTTYPSGWMPDSESGRRLWLVFKGIQGTINIQKLGLDGVDLIYKAKTISGTDTSWVETIRPAIKLSFDATQPILIRNFGFNALALEQDDFDTSMTNANKLNTTNEPTGETVANAQKYGYLKANTYIDPATLPENVGDYQIKTATPSPYDYGKETGFIGMKMNGNLALQGNIKMFACDGTHPRC